MKTEMIMIIVIKKVIEKKSQQWIQFNVGDSLKEKLSSHIVGYDYIRTVIISSMKLVW